MPLLHNHLMDSCSYVYAKIHYWPPKRGAFASPLPPLNPPLTALLVSIPHSHAFLGCASLAYYHHYWVVFRSHALYASGLLRCMSILNYLAHSKPAKICLLNIGALTPKTPYFFHGCCLLSLGAKLLFPSTINGIMVMGVRHINFREIP